MTVFEEILVDVIESYPGFSPIQLARAIIAELDLVGFEAEEPGADDDDDGMPDASTFADVDMLTLMTRTIH